MLYYSVHENNKQSFFYFLRNLFKNVIICLLVRKRFRNILQFLRISKEVYMRLKHIPGAEEAIASSPLCIHTPNIYLGAWHSIFQNSNPIHIEIGMGKGRFLTQLALQHADINYIGIEKYSSVLFRAVQKIQNMEVDVPVNLRFICTDAEKITEFFAPGEISKIYLNFSDPWPKERHAKRRLTSIQFLNRYKQILVPNGRLEFKTDNKDLFIFSLNEIEKSRWNLIAYTYDLHHDEKLNKQNIMTEYEEKFSSLGNPIYKLIISKT